MNEPSPTASDEPEPEVSKADSTSSSDLTDSSDMTGEASIEPAYHPWLERYLWLMVATTFFLIMLGGTVTSKDAGLAVPDWPHTFGYNMLLYPPSKWVGGIFWEHTHRLLATLLGMMALVLTGWALLAVRLRQTIRILSGVILVLVIIQGVMGGMRVTEISTALGVVHGVTAQIFFALLLITAVLAGKRWHKVYRAPAENAPPTTSLPAKDQGYSSLTLAYLFLGILIIQLALGATMRHNKAGLAIPDFPTAYGQIIPPLSVKGIEHATDTKAGGDQHIEGYYSPFKVSIHFAHRLWAISVLVFAILLISSMAKRSELQEPILRNLSLAIIGLLVVQVCLGALVIWTGRQAEIATAHQTTGAAILGVTTLLMMNLKISASISAASMDRNVPVPSADEYRGSVHLETQ